MLPPTYSAPDGQAPSLESSSVTRLGDSPIPVESRSLFGVSQGMGRDHAVVAYDRMAPIYDEFNAGNDYEVWLGEVLLPEMEKHGLRQGGRVLDVGCGTGRAVPPLLDRGWDITGIDSSDEMLEQAWAKYKGCVALLGGDARSLPVLTPPHDLILALNDVVNYLTEDGDLELFFGGVKKNLAPHGLVCFDANTLGLFESSFTPEQNGGVDSGNSPLNDRGWTWSGLTSVAGPSGIFEAELAGEGLEAPSVHRERHWTQEEVEAAMEACGLRCLSVLGQRETETTVVLDPEPDEQRHYKLIYIGGHDG